MIRKKRKVETFTICAGGLVYCVTTFYLIRHGANDWIGKRIAGWTPGVHLNEAGRAQAQALAERLAREPIQQIICSPLERTRETAEPLARKLSLPIQTSEAVGEIRFGDWTGKTMDELTCDPKWKLFNTFRSGTRIPNGELMSEAQARMVTEIERLRYQFPNQGVAICSHGDPIRAALTYFLGMPLDFFQRIEISPTSVSVLVFDSFGAKILRLNCSA